MSRARPILGHWFDVQKNNQKATEEQLELLATIENCDLEDLLDGLTFGEDYLTQGDVVRRLREALGQTIPDNVIARREVWRAARRLEKDCRFCGRVGDSTKHHFVNRWILKELEGYQRHWADRIQNCVPLCIHCHRDLHTRSGNTRSIAPHLNDREKDFAEKAIQALFDQRPNLFLLIARGEDTVYETRLIRDWLENKFVSLAA